MNTQKPYLIGVSGGSASGKTYLLKQLLHLIPKERITLISQDNYYKKLDDQKRKPDGRVNFDHPDSIDLDKFSNDLSRVMKGESVKLLEYTFNNPKIVPKEIEYRPAPIILAEGLFIFYKKELAEQLDLKVFVDADEHIKLSRRIIRDFSERGYSLDEILKQYEEDVIPMYNQFVKPYKETCDIIVPNNKHMEKAIEVIYNHLMLKSGGMN